MEGVLQGSGCQPRGGLLGLGGGDRVVRQARLVEVLALLGVERRVVRVHAVGVIVLRWSLGPKRERGVSNGAKRLGEPIMRTPSAVELQRHAGHCRPPDDRLCSLGGDT